MPIELAKILELLSLNKSVIPSGGGSTKKAPVIDWVKYQTQLPTKEEITLWYKDLHPTLWGIVTGRLSGIVVFDTDSKEPQALFEKAKLAPHVITKRGCHYYFKHPGLDRTLNNKAGILPHLDMRGDGGFVNCLGNNDNANYRLVISPKEENIYKLTQLPPEIKQALLNDNYKPTSTATIGDSIPQGQRNQTLASLAGSMRHRGLSQIVIEQSLLEVNMRCCKPPLPSGEVLNIARSITRYAAGKLSEPIKTKNTVPKIVVRGGILISGK